MRQTSAKENHRHALRYRKCQCCSAEIHTALRLRYCIHSQLAFPSYLQRNATQSTRTRQDDPVYVMPTGVDVVRFSVSDSPAKRDDVVWVRLGVRRRCELPDNVSRLVVHVHPELNSNDIPRGQQGRRHTFINRRTRTQGYCEHNPAAGRTGLTCSERYLLQAVQPIWSSH